MKPERVGLIISTFTSLVLLVWISVQASDRYKEHKIKKTETDNKNI